MKNASLLAKHFYRGIGKNFLDGLGDARLVRGDRFGFELGFHDCLSKDSFQGVDLVLDVVAELEGGDHAFLDLDGFAGAGIACRTSLARLAGESPEPADFDGVAFNEFLANEFEELLYDNLNIVAHKSGGLGDFLN